MWNWEVECNLYVRMKWTRFCAHVRCAGDCLERRCGITVGHQFSVPKVSENLPSSSVSCKSRQQCTPALVNQFSANHDTLNRAKRPPSNSHQVPTTNRATTLRPSQLHCSLQLQQDRCHCRPRRAHRFAKYDQREIARPALRCDSAHRSSDPRHTTPPPNRQRRRFPLQAAHALHLTPP